MVESDLRPVMACVSNINGRQQMTEFRDHIADSAHCQLAKESTNKLRECMFYCISYVKKHDI